MSHTGHPKEVFGTLEFSSTSDRLNKSGASDDNWINMSVRCGSSWSSWLGWRRPRTRNEMFCTNGQSVTGVRLYIWRY